MKRRFKSVITGVLTLTLASSVLTQAYAYDVVQIEGVDQDGKATTISGFMKDGVPVPYVDVVEYMNKVYDPENVFSLSSQGSGVYEIGNAKGNMIVDTIKDALHSDRIEQIPLPLILTLQSTE